MNVRIRAFPAVFHLIFCVYSTEKALAEAFDRSLDAVVLDDVNAYTCNHYEFMLQVKRHIQVTFLQSSVLRQIPGIAHAFSTRRAERPDFTLGPSDSGNPIVQVNRARFLDAAGAPGWPILKLKQVHSSVVCDMDDTQAAGNAVQADAAVTSLRGAMLGVQTADCVPILVADRRATAVAAIHAGWRGTAAGISSLSIQRLVSRFHVDPQDLTVILGPHIGVCCYEVGEEVTAMFVDPAVIERRAEWRKPHLNLAEANRRQFIQAGIASERIVVSSLCTLCREDLFFSYRRDGTKAGRMLSVIGIVP
jgi:YfiH family protein